MPLPSYFVNLQQENPTRGVSFCYRMHDLGEFMKGWLQRFTQWFNRAHERTGGLWEDKFKSVIVEDGCAAKTVAVYIDLNPVRAGMEEDPARYRWSSYGEAMGGGAKGDGNKARAGLVRALRAHRGFGADARHWPGDVEAEYRLMLLEAGREVVEERVAQGGVPEKRRLRKGMTRERSEREIGDAARGPGRRGCGSADGGDAGAPGEIFRGRGGGREPRVRGRGVPRLPGALRGEAQDGRAQAARRGLRRRRGVMEPEGSEGADLIRGGGASPWRTHQPQSAMGCFRIWRHNNFIRPHLRHRRSRGLLANRPHARPPSH